LNHWIRFKFGQVGERHAFFQFCQTCRGEFAIADVLGVGEDVIGEELVFSYDDVLRIQCVGSNGFISDTYLAKYWGEVLSVSSFNGELVYSVPDKNFSSQ